MLFRQCAVLLAGPGLVAGFHAPIPARPLSRIPALSMSSSIASQEAVGTSAANAGSEELFDWNKQWYPLLSLKDTDTGRAHAVQVNLWTM